MNETLGGIIKSKRIELGLTLRGLAKKANISHPYLSQLENGKNRKPSYTVARQLAEVLEIPFEQIEVFTGEHRRMDLVEENKRLREALGFYANESNHDDCKPYCENCLNSPIDYDKGQIARQALEGDSDE